jgi:hypothetical protein
MVVKIPAELSEPGYDEVGDLEIIFVPRESKSHRDRDVLPCEALQDGDTDLFSVMDEYLGPDGESLTLHRVLATLPRYDSGLARDSYRCQGCRPDWHAPSKKH